MVRLASAAVAALLLCGSSALAQTTPDPGAPAAASTPTAEAAPTAAPAPAVAAAPAADEGFQILRTGDRELSCDQLAAEFNTLNGQMERSRQAEAQARAQAQAQAQKSRARRGVLGGLARGALGVASLGGFGMGLDGMVAASAAASALDTAGSVVTMRDMMSALRGDIAPDQTVTPERQRLARVSSLFQEKGC